MIYVNNAPARAKRPIATRIRFERPGRWESLLIALALAGSLARPALADESDALNVVLGASLVHDSNLFRLPASVDPQAALGKSTKSERIGVTYAGLRIDKPYAQQRFQFAVTETFYRYHNFSFLDFEAFEYRAAWLWHLSPRVSGTLSAEHRESLVPFTDNRVFERNLRATDNRVFNLDAQVSGGWHLLAGVSQYQSKNERAFLAEGDVQLNGAEAGVKYLAASGNAVALVQRSRRGEYLNRVLNPATFFDDAFREDETELRANWSPGGASALRGRLGWLERRHEHFAERNFSGTVGELDYTWTPTGKLRLDFAARRELAAWWEAAASYRANTALSFTPSWQLGAKTALRLRLDYTASDYRGPVVALAAPARRDTVRSAQLTLDWAPLRSVTVGASLQRQTRASNNAAFDFSDTTASLSAALKF